MMLLSHDALAWACLPARSLVRSLLAQAKINNRLRIVCVCLRLTYKALSHKSNITVSCFNSFGNDPPFLSRHHQAESIKMVDPGIALDFKGHCIGHDLLKSRLYPNQDRFFNVSLVVGWAEVVHLGQQAH